MSYTMGPSKATTSDIFDMDRSDKRGEAFERIAKNKGKKKKVVKRLTLEDEIFELDMKALNSGEASREYFTELVVDFIKKNYTRN